MTKSEGVPNGGIEKVDYGSMSFSQLKSDPIAGPILEQMSLQYLKNKDTYWFDKKFTGEFDSKGFLIAKTARYANSKPSDHINGSLTGPEEVVEMVRAELKKLKLI